MKNVVLICAAAILSLNLISCRETTQEKTEEAAKAIGKDLEDGARKAGDKIKEGAKKVKEEVHEEIHETDDAS